MRFLTLSALAFSFLLLAGCASTSAVDSSAESTTPKACCASADGGVCAACAAEGKAACAACAVGEMCPMCAAGEAAACPACAAGEACAQCAAKHDGAAASPNDAASASPDTAPLKSSSAEPTATIAAKGMSCPQCSSNVDRRLMKVDGVKWTNIDLGNGIVTVGLDPNKPTPSAEELQTAVRDAGFTAEDVTLPEGEAAQ